MAADQRTGFGHYFSARNQFAAVGLGFRLIQLAPQPALEAKLLFERGPQDVGRVFDGTGGARFNALCQSLWDFEARHVWVRPSRSTRQF